MLEVILVGNMKAGRLEAEVRNKRYDLVAIVYEDTKGWHVEQHGSEKLPDDLLAKIKDELSSHPNRKGYDARRNEPRRIFALALGLASQGRILGC